LNLDDALDEIFAEDEGLPPSEAHGFRLVPGDDVTEVYLLTDIPGAAAFTVRVAAPDGTSEDATLLAPGEWISEFHELAPHETAWDVSMSAEPRMKLAIERPGSAPLELTLGMGM
jgi:hypothetical protein